MRVLSFTSKRCHESTDVNTSPKEKEEEEFRQLNTRCKYACKYWHTYARLRLVLGYLEKIFISFCQTITKMGIVLSHVFVHI